MSLDVVRERCSSSETFPSMFAYDTVGGYVFTDLIMYFNISITFFSFVTIVEWYI